jgi:hypothetical protein
VHDAATVVAQRKLHGCDLWRTSFAVLKPSLIAAAQLLAAWAAEAAALTSDWALGVDAGGHLWQGAAAADSELAAFRERLEQVSLCSRVSASGACTFSAVWAHAPALESPCDAMLTVLHVPALARVLLWHKIYDLRELVEQLAGMFSQEEAAALGLPGLLAPFGQLAALHVSEYTAGAWASAHSEHERRLEGVEARVVQKLKELFGGLCGTAWSDCCGHACATAAPAGTFVFTQCLSLSRAQRPSSCPTSPWQQASSGQHATRTARCPCLRQRLPAPSCTPSSCSGSCGSLGVCWVGRASWLACSRSSRRSPSRCRPCCGTQTRTHTHTHRQAPLVLLSC